MDKNERKRREELAARLKPLNEAIGRIHDQMRPLDDALRIISGEQSAMIEAVLGDKEQLGICETCEVIMAEGDQGFIYADSDGILCERCSPTYGDLGRSRPQVYESTESYDDTQKMVKDHVAAGGSLDDKYLWVL